MKYSVGFFLVILFSFSIGQKLGEWSPFSNCSRSTRTRTCRPAHKCKGVQLVQSIPCATHCTGLLSLRDQNTTTLKRSVQFDPNLNRGNTLRDGQTLYVGNYLSSGNGYYAVMQDDGNFVLFVTQHWVPRNAFWASNSDNKGVYPRRAVLQSDGNFVIFDAYNRATWASGTNQKGWNRYSLVMQTDGNLVIFNAENKPTWATGTNRG